MSEISLPPYAPALVESMRAVGYSFESALADLLDNSISAGATSVAINFPPECSYIGILDNGCGLAPDDLTAAMRHGSTNPLAIRFASDLGRFGLGLKTASLSQCRRLTVVSLKDGIMSGRRWDLDLVDRRKDWILEALETTQITCLPCVDQLAQTQHGTLVLWESFDRLAAGHASVVDAVEEGIDQSRHHLGLIFHRFMVGEPGQQKLLISINNDPIEPQDPFLIGNRATQALPEEKISVEGTSISVQAFILPHPTKLSKKDIVLAGGEKDLFRDQGFYIYRNRRLLLYGTWFRLIAIGELTKLARVRVDIPNSLDHLWSIDIKKSAAIPPKAVRTALSRIVDKIADGSRRVYTYRGRTQGNGRLSYAWDKIEDREGVAYRINRRHPLVAALSLKLSAEELALLSGLVETIETSLPLDALYADLAQSRAALSQDADLDEDLLYEIARPLVAAYEGEAGGTDGMLAKLRFVEPFCLKPEIAERVIARLTDDIRKRS